MAVASAHGLSPRVRGNPCGPDGGGLRTRSIPARAGGTYHASSASCGISGLSPRVRGNRARGGPESTGTGSIPRVRGNHGEVLRSALVIGSIPARAGEPPRKRHPRSVRRVYPRACGGTQFDASWTVVRSRSIPARAGEPGDFRLRYHPMKVYPRACGGTAAGISASCGL